jgi:hypothetical protein
VRNAQYYVVLTGDIIGSTVYHQVTKKSLGEPITSAFRVIETWKKHLLYAPVQIYRGDSFQAVLNDPVYALRAAIIIRAALRSFAKVPAPAGLLDCRIAIGIGKTELAKLYQHQNRYDQSGNILLKNIETNGSDTPVNNDTSNWLGKAFTYSGALLDDKESRGNLMVHTPWSNINNELEMEFALLDLIIENWGHGRSEVMKYRIQGLKQEDISKELNISQPAVNRRLKGAGGHVIDSLCRRFEQLIGDKIGPAFYKREL